MISPAPNEKTEVDFGDFDGDWIRIAQFPFENGHQSELDGVCAWPEVASPISISFLSDKMATIETVIGLRSCQTDSIIDTSTVDGDLSTNVKWFSFSSFFLILILLSFLLSSSISYQLNVE